MTKKQSNNPKTINNVIVPCSFKEKFKVTRSSSKMEALFNKVRNADDGTKRTIVQFINMGVFHPKALPVASDFVVFSALQGNRKTLLLDSSKDGHLVRNMVDIDPDFKANTDLNILSVTGTELYLLEMSQYKNGGLVEKEDLALLFDALRDDFDLILVYSRSPLSSPESLSFVDFTQGCVLVLQAEKTRVPVMKHVIEQLNFSGAHIIGTVLDGRRFYIPKTLYRLFFRS